MVIIFYLGKIILEWNQLEAVLLLLKIFVECLLSLVTIVKMLTIFGLLLAILSVLVISEIRRRYFILAITK